MEKISIGTYPAPGTCPDPQSKIQSLLIYRQGIFRKNISEKRIKPGREVTIQKREFGGSINTHQHSGNTGRNHVLSRGDLSKKVKVFIRITEIRPGMY